MDLEELKNIWSDYDKKLDKNLRLNKTLLKQINLDKAESKLNKVVWLRVLEGFCFLFIMVLLGRFIAMNFSATAPVISAVVLDIFAIIGFTGSIKQIVLLKQIDYADSIITIQKQLEKVNAHSLQIFKLLILSAPFHMAYVFLGFKAFFNVDLFSFMSRQDRMIQIFSALITTIPTIWLYKKLNYNNRQVKWINALIEGIVGEQVTSAINFLKEIEEFETDSQN